MKKYIVELTSEERSGLKDIIKAKRMAAHKRRHAHILLKADQGPQGSAWKDADIANAFDCKGKCDVCRSDGRCLRSVSKAS